MSAKLADFSAGVPHEIETRARQSLGISEQAVYEMVARSLSKRDAGGELVLDVGCGAGNLWPFVRKRFARYVGMDVVRYEGFPSEAEFCCTNLETDRIPFAEGRADAVLAVETIEHLENPRAFMRALVKLAKPGGWIIVTTPNIANLLSLLTLTGKQRFAAFQDCDYPAHISPVLAVDLQRMADECDLQEIALEYSLHGRIILTGKHYPRWLTRLLPRWCSDNVLLAARKKLL